MSDIDSHTLTGLANRLDAYSSNVDDVGELVDEAIAALRTVRRLLAEIQRGHDQKLGRLNLRGEARQLRRLVREWFRSPNGAGPGIFD